MEGPSIILLREELAQFIDRRVLAADGKFAAAPRLKNQTLRGTASWGKLLFLLFESFHVRAHFLMYGSYRVNGQKDRPHTLRLKFRDGELRCYSTAMRLIEEPFDSSAYELRTDPMSERWSARFVVSCLKRADAAELGDLLLDQNIFSGVGNIIKNEVLYRLRLHPEERLEGLDTQSRRALVREAHRYCWEFYHWKKAFELKKHWQVYRKRTCPTCGGPISMRKTGQLNRVSFYCPICQPKSKKGRRG